MNAGGGGAVNAGGGVAVNAGGGGMVNVGLGAVPPNLGAKPKEQSICTFTHFRTTLMLFDRHLLLVRISILMRTPPQVTQPVRHSSSLTATPLDSPPFPQVFYRYLISCWNPDQTARLTPGKRAQTF